MERAPSGLRLVESSYSPLDPQQEDNFQGRNFIESSRAITSEVLPSILFNPLELYWDFTRLVADYLRSCQEYVQLRQNPVHLDKNLPRGDGSTVVIIGGFRTVAVSSYSPTIDEFSELGYKVIALPDRVNTEPPQVTARKCEATIREEAARSGHKVKIIGHSLGGFDELAMFIKNPEEFVELVDHAVFCASPRPLRINKAMGLALVVQRWLKRDVDFEIGEKSELLKKFCADGVLQVTSVDSSSDPVVDGQFFGLPKDHFVIKGASHAGLAYHPDFLRLVAFRFAGKEVDLGRYTNVLQPPKVA